LLFSTLALLFFTLSLRKKKLLRKLGCSLSDCLHFFQACYNFVYIVSNWKLEDQYHNIRLEQPETYNALMRKIHKVRVYDNPGKWQEYDTENYLHGFRYTDKEDTPFKQA